MKVIVAGSTGMVGELVLKNCLDAPQVTEVVSLVRKPTARKHHKLTELVVKDFQDSVAYEDHCYGVQAAFFCIGVYTGQVPDGEFRKITVDYAAAFGKALEKHSPQATLCLLSGAGADQTEKSRTPFARYKGMAENQLAALDLRFYSFRPAYIYPVTPRKEPNFGYRVIKFMYPVLKIFGDKYSITSQELAKAIFNVGMKGADQQILENKDILRYAN